MSVWLCAACGTLSGPNCAPCPSCGGVTSRAEFLPPGTVRLTFGPDNVQDFPVAAQPFGIPNPSPANSLPNEVIPEGTTP